MALNANEVKALYVAYLGRAADQEGLTYWTEQVPDDFTLADLRYNLVNSQPEYQEIYGGLDREGVVTEIYQNMFGREPDAEGLAYWTTGGGSSLSIDKLQQQFIVSASAEDRAAFEERVDELGVGGDTFTLTDSAVTGELDTVIGTESNDSIEADSDSYESGDVIIDQSSDDNDTLTLSADANVTATPSVKNIENVNVNASKVGSFTFDAQGIVGAETVTVNRLDLQDGAIDGSGNVSITNASAATYVAGEQVNNFSVGFASNAEAATVNATNASGTASVTGIDEGGVTLQGAADQDVSVAGNSDSAATVVTSGEVAVTNGVADLTLEAGEEATFSVNQIGDSLTLAGEGDITLEMAAAALSGEELSNNASGSVNVVVDNAGTLDLTDVAAVTSVELDDDFSGNTVTTNSDQLVTTSTDQNGTLTVDSAEANATAKFATLDNEDEDAAVVVDALTFGDGANEEFDSVELEAEADELTVTSNLTLNGASLSLTGSKSANLGTIVGADAIVSASTGDVTLISSGNGTATAAGEQAISTGSGDDVVEVNDNSANSSLFVVNLGDGENELTITDVAAESQFVTGVDNDTVTLATNTGDIAISTGEGDDTLVVTNAVTTSNASIDLGAGDNSLSATATADISNTDLSGEIASVNVASNETLTVNAEQFSSMGAFELTGAGTLEVDASSATDDVTLDASQVELSFGAQGSLTLVGGSGDDTITGALSGDTLTGNAGDDTFVFGNIDEGGDDTITDFTTTEDTIQLSATDLNDLVSGSNPFSAGDVLATDAGSFLEIGATDGVGAATEAATGVAGTVIFDSNTGNLIFDASGDTTYTDDGNTGLTDAKGDDVIIATLGTPSAGDIVATDFAIA